MSARLLEKSDHDAETAFRNLLAYLARLDIEAPVVPYPAHRTVEEGMLLRGAMAGTFTMNLLLRDHKRRLFLVSVHEDRTLDLKTIHTHIGARGQLSFAPTEDMTAILGIAPGTMTPLALMNDSEQLVTCVLDATLLEATQINFSPAGPDQEHRTPPGPTPGLPRELRSPAGVARSGGALRGP